MNIQKTSGMVLPPQTVPSVQAASSMPLAKPSAAPASAVMTPAAWTPSSLIAAAGLPADKLSASILSFARFFSLPLQPELMAEIRRQSLPPSISKDDLTIAKNRETLSLAAAAAESKGVELRPKGLESFAEAIDPDWQRRQDSDERYRRGRRDKNSDGREKEGSLPKTNPLSASALREMALESAEKDPLLAILNRISGKNGQHWIILPFSFCESGREFKVSLRILLETDNQTPNRAICMALDIAESGETGQRRLFVLESGNSPAAKLSVYLQPELPPAAIEPFIGELSHLMGIPPMRISVKNHTESFPCESNRGNDLLYSINEAV